ncbi:thioesterase family protein [Acidiferrimicrobium sp. IK]|uniref:PaaI family thioesterase n=1 Tax=Acidiferrimicrobium sp. IK TaxID=2871700 RepID=UPI0021CB1AB8|nr:acyl-CoA thioesterase domain-containing protein [Acidiferrimicrobium sp. IK]MCU4182912.1 thioesterase family protein [Acidiferrimicrobium sp. IK]
MTGRADAVTDAGPGPVPTDNFVSDLDITELLVSEQRCLVMAPATEELRRGGAALLGAVATMVDVGASHPAMIASRPGWITTQDLSVHSTGIAVEGPIVVDCRLARAGSKVVTVSAAGYDCRGLSDVEAVLGALDEAASLTALAKSLITFARIPRSAAPGMDGYDPRQWIGEVRRMPAVASPATVGQRMGVEVIDAGSGRLQLQRRPYLTNSIGTILGGAQFMLAALAAERAQPGRQTLDLQMHFLAQVKVGPAHTRVEVVRAGVDHRVLSVEVLDAGDGGRVLSMATVTLT